MPFHSIQDVMKCKMTTNCSRVGKFNVCFFFLVSFGTSLQNCEHISHYFFTIFWYSTATTAINWMVNYVYKRNVMNYFKSFKSLTLIGVWAWAWAWHRFLSIYSSSFSWIIQFVCYWIHRMVFCLFSMLVEMVSALDFRFNCLVTFEVEIVMKKGKEEKKSQTIGNLFFHPPN